MHSCELTTNLRAKKVLCHRVEVVKNFRCCNIDNRVTTLLSMVATTDCVFCNVIGCWQIPRRKAIKPRNRPKVTRPFFPRERAGSGHETRTRLPIIYEIFDLTSAYEVDSVYYNGFCTPVEFCSGISFCVGMNLISSKIYHSHCTLHWTGHACWPGYEYQQGTTEN